MVQPSYPHTVELPHSSPKSNSKGTPQQTGADMASTDMAPDLEDMAPPDNAPPESHANLSDAGQAERPGTKPVNPGSTIRKEAEPGPGVPH